MKMKGIDTMRKNYIYYMLAAAMSVSLITGVTGCSSNTATTATTVQSESTSSSDSESTKDLTYGQVTKVSDSSITVTVGTLKDDSSSELDLSDETKEIEISDSTTITRGMGGAPSGEAPSGEAPSGEKPSSEAPSGEAPSGEAPSGEASSGEASDNSSDDKSSNDSSQNNTPPEKPEEQKLSISDISEGDNVSISYNEDGSVDTITILTAGGGQPGGQPGGQSSGVDSYSSVNEYTKDTTVENETIKSTGTDENAVLVDSDSTVSISNSTIDRTSSDSTGGDNSSFYGVGAAVLGTDGTTYVKDSTITTDAAGAAGIFAYNNAKVYTSNTSITTQQDTSGGIHVAGGGSLYAWDLNVETNGQSAAAIRSDRGGGTMVVDGGTYTSNGVGSPAVYTTADIAVNNADLTANGSEAVCIEGLNNLRLYDCNLTGNMSDDSQNDCTWNVILYQSMSGDSEEGNSNFEMDGGTLTAKNGGMFYTTNTESSITLSNVDINYADDNDFFLQCTGNNNQRGWGTSGSNGADCNFTAIKQDMEGNVIWDSISQLDFYMTDGSTLKGAFVNDETYAGNGGDGYANVYIDKDSTWTVTGDSTVTNLYNAGTIQDADGKTVTVKSSDGTVYVEGDSEYTITVSSYSTDVNTSGANKVTSFSNYQVEKPSELA